MNNLQITKNFIKKIERKVYDIHPNSDLKVRFLDSGEYAIQFVTFYKGTSIFIEYKISNYFIEKYEFDEQVIKFIVQQLEKIYTDKIFRIEEKE